MCSRPGLGHQVLAGPSAEEAGGLLKAKRCDTYPWGADQESRPFKKGDSL